MTPDEISELKDLFDNAPCGYLSLEISGRIIKTNHTFCQWIGRDESEVRGRRFHEFLNISGKIYYETHFAPLLRMQGYFNEVALDLKLANGNTLPVIVNAVERRDAKGDVLFVRLIIMNAADRRRYERDLLSARRAAETAKEELLGLNQQLEQKVAEALEARMKSEDALRQAQKMEAIGQLTGGIAHDFNNMLSVVLGSLNLLERRTSRGEDGTQFITSAKDGVNRAARLVQRLLAFARQQDLAPEPVNVNDLVGATTELLRRTLGETIELETHLDESLWLIQVDVSMLENAILNLAINARDAMPDGGRLLIKTANHLIHNFDDGEETLSAEPYVRITVRDTGTGMPDEVIARAFEPFFTTKGVGKGTGLGLSQVFGFVKQSNGHIKIDSAVGKGTAIDLLFPRISLDRTEGTKSNENVHTPTGCETVLLVEDDVQVLKLSTAMLNSLGYKVIAVQHPAEALARLNEKIEADLLLTDVIMPEMTGPDLAQEALRQRPGLKVLFMSGYTGDIVVRTGLLASAQNLIKKPFSLTQLGAQVRNALEHNG